MKWQIIVGNVGNVLDTDNGFQASKEFNQWKGIVKSATGRAAGETVTLMRDGEPHREYTPPPRARCRTPGHG